MPTLLEQEFRKEMISIYKRAKDEIGFVATRFIQMIDKHGGVETARILINADNPSGGFTRLWEEHRLDLSVEALVLNPKWVTLFSSEEIAKARQRLSEYE